MWSRPMAAAAAVTPSRRSSTPAEALSVAAGSRALPRSHERRAGGDKEAGLAGLHRGGEGVWSSLVWSGISIQRGPRTPLSTQSPLCKKNRRRRGREG